MLVFFKRQHHKKIFIIQHIKKNLLLLQEDSSINSIDLTANSYTANNARYCTRLLDFLDWSLLSQLSIQYDIFELRSLPKAQDMLQPYLNKYLLVGTNLYYCYLDHNNIVAHFISSSRNCKPSIAVINSEEIAIRRAFASFNEYAKFKDIVTLALLTQSIKKLSKHLTVTNGSLQYLNFTKELQEPDLQQLGTLLKRRHHLKNQDIVGIKDILLANQCYPLLDWPALAISANNIACQAQAKITINNKTLTYLNNLTISNSNIVVVKTNKALVTKLMLLLLWTIAIIADAILLAKYLGKSFPVNKDSLAIINLLAGIASLLAILYSIAAKICIFNKDHDIYPSFQEHQQLLSICKAITAAYQQSAPRSSNCILSETNQPEMRTTKTKLRFSSLFSKFKQQITDKQSLELALLDKQTTATLSLNNA